jgi:hypothetical protein
MDPVSRRTGGSATQWRKMTVNKRIWVLFIALMIVMGGAYLWVRNPVSTPGISRSFNPEFFQFMGLTVCCVGVTGFAVINSYKKLFGKIILELDNLASGIEGASYQIKIKGTEGLSRAQRQTAAIDETARFHGQIVDQIRNNAQNVNEANGLMANNVQQIEAANHTLQRLIASMGDIKRESQNIYKIVDDMNDIATKTNLLAINAGVESSRAGHAGKAFGIIAGEVRNLALCSSASSRETTSLLEKTIGSIENGAVTVNQMVQDFNQMAEQIASMKSCMAHIGQTADEQVKGILHLDGAVGELTTLGIENAANAKDTEAISTTLQTQGERLRSFISEIIAQTLLRGNVSSEDLSKFMLDFRRIGQRLRALRPERPDHESVLLKWQKSHPAIVSAVYSCRADGSFIFSNPPAGISNAKIRPWWQRAMVGEYFTSPVYISAIDNNPCRTISIPYINSDRIIVGVIGADLKIG